MPNRSLATIALIVWSAAALVALILGLPTLLTMEGVHVDAGLIVGALAVIGAFTAAGTAAWVATSERRRSAKAQAQLVVLNITQARINPDVEDSPLQPVFDIQVDNYGELSILDVRLESAWLWMPQSSTWVGAAWLAHADVFQVVPSHRETGADFRGRTEFRWGVVFLDAHHQQVIQQEIEGLWPQINLDRLAATITFTDAHGQRWIRSRGELIERL